MKSYNILIIDDEGSNIEIIIAILERTKLNFNFYHAANGRKGIEIAKKHKPNIIILDWLMPGLSGIETLEILKNDSLTRHIPAIMTTAKMTAPEHLEQALEAGAIDYLRKPIDPLELRARVNAMLHYSDRVFELITAKDKEISSTVLNMLDFNSYLKSIRSKLQDVVNNGGEEHMKNEIASVLKMIETKENENDIEHFESFFQRIHPYFFGNISGDFPDLTPGELKLAALLRLNLSSKEIAAITYTSAGTVKTARFRLRKKMNLSNDENIVNFLMRY